MIQKKKKLYMKLDIFKKISGTVTLKARSMGLPGKIAMLLTSRKFILVLVLTGIAALWANDNICSKGVAPKCLFSMTGETAVAGGTVTRVEFISRGVKNLNDYGIFYTFTAGGKSYDGQSFQKGLVYRKGSAIDITYSVKDPSCSCGGGKCPIEDAMFTVIFGGALLLIALFIAQRGIRRMLKTIWIIEHGTAATATVRAVSRSSRIVWTTKSATTVSRWDVNCKYKDMSGTAFTFDIISPSEDYIQSGDEIAILYDPGMPENVIAVDALPFFVKTNPVLGS